MINTLLQIGAVILALGLGLTCFAAACWYNFNHPKDMFSWPTEEEIDESGKW